MLTTYTKIRSRNLIFMKQIWDQNPFSEDFLRVARFSEPENNLGRSFMIMASSRCQIYTLGWSCHFSSRFVNLLRLLRSSPHRFPITPFDLNYFGVNGVKPLGMITQSENSGNVQCATVQVYRRPFVWTISLVGATFRCEHLRDRNPVLDFQLELSACFTNWSLRSKSKDVIAMVASIFITIKNTPTLAPTITWRLIQQLKSFPTPGSLTKHYYRSNLPKASSAHLSFI